MNPLKISLIVMLTYPAVLGAEAPPEWIAQPVVIVELRSYGEQPQNLIELLVPFVVTLGFTDGNRSQALRDSGINQALMRSTDGDLVGLRGDSFNCVVVEYFVTRPWRPLRGEPSTKERGQSFKNSLEMFLRGLPTPRVSMHYMEWGSTLCAHAP